MAYAIIRIAKLTSQVHAHNATTHNYRQHAVSNADPAPQHPNKEYLNHEKTDYWTLAEARIAEVVTRKVRADQVRAVEVIMTGSPEAFVRGQDGRAADYSNSKWAQDNLNFLKEKFGAKNVVSFTLHQDEKTPHVHAVIVPITQDGRLSAKDIFTRQTLRELQTDYAQAMQPYGMSRGIEHSQAEHQPMRRQYGQEAENARQVAELSKPAAATVREPFKLDDVPLMGRDTWKAEQEARINAEIAQRVAQVQAQERERVEKLAELAQKNTAAPEQVKTLQKQLGTSEGLKQGHFTGLQERDTQVDWLYNQRERLAVELAQGGGALSKQLEGEGKIRTENARKELVSVVETTLTKPIRDQTMFLEELKKAGWAVGKDGIVNEKNGAVFSSKELKPNGLDLMPQLAAACERTKAAEFAQSAAGKLAAEQAQRQVRGQQAHEGRAVLEMEVKDLETIKKHFLDVRAGVRPGAVQADGRVQLEVVYQHTQPTIRSINELLNKAQKWTGVTVQEDSHDREQRQVGAERRGQELKAKKGQSKGQNQGFTR
jgi:cell division protein FtsB